MRLRNALCFLVVLGLTPAAWASANAPSRIVVAVLPVYDASFESYGVDLANNLTYLVFRSLLGGRIEPLLLNPGGNYNPDDEDFIREFGKESGADAVLISKLTEDPGSKGSNNVLLALETRLISLSDKKESPPHKATATITKHELDESTREALRQASRFWFSVPYTERTAMLASGAGSAADAGALLSGTKPKTPLAKRAAELASSAGADAVAQAPMLVPQGSGEPEPAKGGPCAIKFAVHYHYKDRQSSSKSYDLIANGREDLGKMSEGVSTLNLPSGVVLLQLELRDAPFGLQTQNWYQTNTYLDCSKPEKNLVMDVAAGGQATLRWE